MTQQYLKYRDSYKKAAAKWYLNNKHKIKLYHKTTKYKLSKKKSMLNWILEKKAFIQQFKYSPCVDCKQYYNPWQLDFDHIEGKKKYNIGRLMYASESKVISELVKCELVCANCHRNRTYNRYFKELVS